MSVEREDGLVIHQATGWLVDVERGRIYGTRQGSAGNVLGGPDRNGWWRINRRHSDGQVTMWSAPRIIWEVATGQPVPDGYMVDHENGDRSDLRIANLVCIPMWRGGRLRYPQIRELLASPLLVRQLAAKYGVTERHIYHLRSNRDRWEHPLRATGRH